MKIDVIGWETSGLRCPDMTVDITQEGTAPSHVALLQMPNGTGKTTTLNMMRAAMNGEAESWNADKIKAFRRPGEEISEGRFILKLRVDERPLTFELTLDYEEGVARYRTTAPGSGGVNKGWVPPPAVRRFLNERFVRLFVFDGEFADRLLDPRESEADKAIDALCQLYLLEDIRQKALEHWQETTKKSGVKSDKGLTMWRNKAAKLRTSVKKIGKAAIQAKEQIEKLTMDIKELENKISERFGSQESLRQQLETKMETEKKSKSYVEEEAAKVMQQIRQPQLLHDLFAISLGELKAQMDRLKLPASTSRQFFMELLQESECVCGRPLDDQTREVLNRRAELYLAEETSGVLNTLKQDIALYLEDEGGANPADLTDSVNHLREYIRENQKAQTEVRAIRQQLIEKGDDVLKELEKELEVKNGNRDDLKDVLEEIYRKPLPADDDKTNCLQALKNQLSEADKKLASITGTLDLRNRTEILEEILEKSLKMARTNLRDILVRECNDRLKSVLSQDPIKIEKIGSSLSLKGQEGASVGQTLSVGYTFLTSLLYRGQHQFPLIVDSPANPLDIEVRREIGKIVPELCKQFIAFTISSEREGFVKALHTQSYGKIKYLTLFRKTSGNMHLLNQLPQNGVMETKNGILVEGQEYFEGFNVEEESEE